jgi:hypothetical protein
MDYNELLQKFNLLLNENDRLIKENSRLRAQLGLSDSELIQNSAPVKNTDSELPDNESAHRNGLSGVDRKSDSSLNFTSAACSSDAGSRRRLFSMRI